ncbi:class I SAM-dependent methyltransferase [Caulobacter sp.]|uniref:class I SAM-dependent methyltransferase n=1 Tax=Caulobacter sp. TaxID=78 RepID=UPI003BAB4488
MHKASDARFWNRISRKYAKDVTTDQGGYERTLDRTQALLRSQDRVLELGCGTGCTALRLADGVASYLATDFSAGMIAIAKQKQGSSLVAGLAFQIATAESPMLARARYDVVLGFNYLHLVRDLLVTLNHIRTLLVPGGLFISKTPCLGDMNPLVGQALLPVMRAVGRAPYVNIFNKAELCSLFSASGFEILAVEDHATKGNGRCPCIVARKSGPGGAVAVYRDA